MGYATFVNFVRVYCICVYCYFNILNSTWFLHSFWKIELTKQMTDQEDNINLGKIVSDDNNQERKSWACLGQTCSRSLIVFLSQLFVFFGLGLGSELVDWYRDATSVPFGHLLIDLSPRRDDRLRYCTNSGSVPSKFYNPERLKHLRTLDDEYTKSLYSPSVPIAFPQMQKSLSSVLSKRVYPFFMRMHSKPAQRKLANQKRHHVVKFQDEVWLLSLKRTTWKQRRNVLSSEKGLQLIAVITPPVINHLSWYGAVCSRPSFCV